MFERITIRQGSSASLGKPIDLGILAEALLFYQDVRLIANRAVLRGLFESTRPDVVVELLESGFLTMSYEDNFVAIQTENTGTPQEIHRPVLLHMPHVELQTLLPQVLEEVVGRVGRARRLANRLARRIEIVRSPQDVVAQALAQLADSAVVQSAVSLLLKTYIPEYHGPATFVPTRDGDRITVQTDIDFAAANRVYHRSVSPGHSSLSTAYLLAHIVRMHDDAYFAALYESEIAIDHVNAVLLQQHVSRHLTPSRGVAARFQDFVFDDSRAIAEAIRSGDRTLEDVLRHLPAAARFKEWLRGETAQADLVKAYFREATAQTWIDRLPTKIARWVVFTGIGFGLDVLGLGGIGGVALNAFDSFLLDRLARGWKPTQFIDDHLRQLVDTQKARSG